MWLHFVQSSLIFQEYNLSSKCCSNFFPDFEMFIFMFEFLFIALFKLGSINILRPAGAYNHGNNLGEAKPMVGRNLPPPPLCVEMGFTRTFPRNQDTTVKLKSELLSIKF